jgi:hypothetical protein
VDGEVLEHQGGEYGVALNNQPITNPQGKLIGIELTGYRDHPDALNQLIKGGPGSVCTNETEKSWTLDEIDYLAIVVNNRPIPIH